MKVYPLLLLILGNNKIIIIKKIVIIQTKINTQRTKYIYINLFVFILIMYLYIFFRLFRFSMAEFPYAKDKSIGKRAVFLVETNIHEYFKNIFYYLYLVLFLFCIFTNFYFFKTGENGKIK